MKDREVHSQWQMVQFTKVVLFHCILHLRHQPTNGIMYGLGRVSKSWGTHLKFVHDCSLVKPPCTWYIDDFMTAVYSSAMKISQIWTKLSIWCHRSGSTLDHLNQCWFDQPGPVVFIWRQFHRKYSVIKIRPISLLHTRACSSGCHEDTVWLAYHSI